MFFIFPPQWIPNQPYLAPYLLSSRAKAKGLECEVIDLNLEFYDYFLSDEIKIELKFSFFDIQKLQSINSKIKTKLNFKNNFASFDLIDSKYKYIFFNSKELLKALFDKDNYFTHFFNEYLNKFKMDNKIIGISIITYNQLLPAITLSYIVKKKFSNTIVILGGNYISRIAEELCKEGKIWEYIDVIITDEGEYSIDYIVETKLKNEKINLFDIPNSISKSGIDSNQNPIPFNMDSYIIPDYSEVNLENYYSPFPIVTVEASRGCYWSKCTFCETTEIRFRKRKVKSIIEEIETLYLNNGVRYFSFSDLAFPSELLFDLAKELIKKKLNIFWKCMIRAEKTFLSKDLDILYISGCRMVLLGVESANRTILKKIKKGIEIKVVKNLIKRLNENNIWVHCYFIIGFPGEKISQIIDTLEFIKQNNKYINSFTISKYILLKDSEIYKNYHDYSISNIVIDAEQNLQTAYFDFETKTKDSITPEIIERIKNLLEIHPYDYIIWNGLEINYLFLYIVNEGIDYFRKKII